MTKIPTEILELAQSSGWYAGYSCRKDPYSNGCVFTAKEDITYEQYKEHQVIIISWQEVALDREFWIALSKSLKWGDDVVGGSYLTRATQFYLLVLMGTDPTEWWAQLIANK